MNKFLIIIIIIILISILGYFKKKGVMTEHFQTRLIKDNYTDIYDTFYSKIYDQLFKSDIKNEYEIYSLKQYIFDKYDKNKINILDLGCGTGNHLKLLTKYKYTCTGLDKSKKILDIARKNNPSLELVLGDYHNKSIFKKREFSHILLLFYTVYYTNVPLKLFRYLNFWLKPTGFICIHLVDRDKFDPVLEKASSLIPLYDPQKYTTNRNTKTELDFNNFKYFSDWNFNKSDVNFIEHFAFKNESKSRKHIHKFTMYPISYYIKLAKKTGFKLVKVIDLTPVNHKDNALYVFQKLYGP